LIRQQDKLYLGNAGYEANDSAGNDNPGIHTQRLTAGVKVVNACEELLNSRGSSVDLQMPTLFWFLAERSWEDDCSQKEKIRNNVSNNEVLSVN